MQLNIVMRSMTNEIEELGNKAFSTKSEARCLKYHQEQAELMGIRASLMQNFKDLSLVGTGKMPQCVTMRKTAC